MFRSREMEGETLSGLIERSTRVNQQPMTKTEFKLSCLKTQRACGGVDVKKLRLTFCFSACALMKLK